MSSLSEVRDYMDWLENQQPPVSHTRARGIVVAIIAIVLALALLLIFWWR